MRGALIVGMNTTTNIEVCNSNALLHSPKGAYTCMGCGQAIFSPEQFKKEMASPMSLKEAAKYSPHFERELRYNKWLRK